MIISCQLAPGTSVSEPGLTSLLKKNKAAVRAALIRLAHDGLVTAVPRSGYSVAPLEVKDALELGQLRLLTEPPAFRLAVNRINPATLKRATQRYSQGYDRSDAHSVNDFLEQNREFKLAIARATGNGRLAAWIEEVSESVDRYLRFCLLYFDLRPMFTEQLLPLCKALEEGRAADAEVLATKNIHVVTNKIVSALLGDNGSHEDIWAGSMSVRL